MKEILEVQVEVSYLAVIEAGFLHNGLDGLHGKSAGSTQMHEYQQLVQRLDKLLTQLLESRCHPAAGLPHVLASQMKTHLVQQLISISTQIGRASCRERV